MWNIEKVVNILIMTIGRGESNYYNYIKQWNLMKIKVVLQSGLSHFQSLLIIILIVIMKTEISCVT